MVNKHHAAEIAAKDLRKALPNTKIEVIDVPVDQYTEDQKKRIKKARDLLKGN